MQNNPNQQPFPRYPNFQPPVPPQAPPPPQKKPSIWRRRVGRLPVWAWVLIAIAIMGIIGSFTGGGSTNNTATTDSTPTAAVAQPTTQATQVPTQVPTPTPTKASKWVVIKEFSGHLSGGDWHYSPYFTVPNNWNVRWQSPDRDQSLPLVTIVGYDHSGNPIAGDDDIAAKGSASDDSGVGQLQKYGGTIRLQVYAQGDWNVEVNVLKQ